MLRSLPIVIVSLKVLLFARLNTFRLERRKRSVEKISSSYFKRIKKFLDKLETFRAVIFIFLRDLIFFSVIFSHKLPEFCIRLF